MIELMVLACSPIRVVFLLKWTECWLMRISGKFEGWWRRKSKKRKEKILGLLTRERKKDNRTRKEIRTKKMNKENKTVNQMKRVKIACLNGEMRKKFKSLMKIKKMLKEMKNKAKIKKMNRTKMKVSLIGEMSSKSKWKMNLLKNQRVKKQKMSKRKLKNPKKKWWYLNKTKTVSMTKVNNNKILMVLLIPVRLLFTRCQKPSWKHKRRQSKKANKNSSTSPKKRKVERPTEKNNIWNPWWWFVPKRTKSEAMKNNWS